MNNNKINNTEYEKIESTSLLNNNIEKKPNNNFKINGFKDIFSLILGFFLKNKKN